MKNLVSLIFLAAALPFHTALGRALGHQKPTQCVNTANFKVYFEHFMCAGREWALYIPDYWLSESYLLDDDRLYFNYDKIICAPDGSNFSMCAFIQPSAPAGPGGVPVEGRQIKKLFRHLAHWCDNSRCGKCRVDEVEGKSRDGWFTIMDVYDMGKCRGVCRPDEA